MNITIIGAGMSGLLAANILRARHNVTVIEAQPSLPNNHHALLRFRSGDIGETIGLPFKKVRVIKDVHQRTNLAHDSMSYAYKCNGTYRTDRSLPSEPEVAQRFVSPPNMIEHMFNMIKDCVKFNTKFMNYDLLDDLLTPADGIYISTLPMPAMMHMTNYPNKPEFRYVRGISVNVEIKDCEAYATLYYPSTNDSDKFFNRASVTGNVLTIEYAVPHLRSEEEVKRLMTEMTWLVDQHVDYVCKSFGIDRRKVITGTLRISPQQYMKIEPIDNDERKRFISHLTEDFNVYSLGRFATWRPNILLDDLIRDVGVIERLSRGTRYDRAKHANKI